jgi:hypothetical protein
MLIARDIFALLVAAVGWHYLFFSGAASRLRGVEAGRSHRIRVLLRRCNGVMLLMLAVLFFVGSQPWLESRQVAFMGVWLGVMTLLLLIVTGALIDIRLTLKLKSQRGVVLKQMDDQS